MRTRASGCWRLRNRSGDRRFKTSSLVKSSQVFYFCLSRLKVKVTGQSGQSGISRSRPALHTPPRQKVTGLTKSSGSPNLALSSPVPVLLEHQAARSNGGQPCYVISILDPCSLLVAAAPAKCWHRPAPLHTRQEAAVDSLSFHGLRCSLA